jgi:hypothetical protein
MILFVGCRAIFFGRFEAGTNSVYVKKNIFQLSYFYVFLELSKENEFLELFKFSSPETA